MDQSPSTTHLFWGLEVFLFAVGHYESGGKSNFSETWVALRSPWPVTNLADRHYSSV